MNILITGGAGYIGSILVPELLKEGHEVIVIDNFMYSPSSLLDCCYDPKLHIARADARDTEILKKYLKGVDIVIPLACLTGAPICDRFPMEAKSINLDAIKLILELRDPDQKIIFPNTNSGYGIGGRDIYCTEEMPLRPISLYGKLKVEAEQELLKDGNAIILRLATVFGISPRMRLDLLVNDFVYRALNDGYMVLFEADFKRNYIHIRDVARAFTHCINNFDRMKNEVYPVRSQAPKASADVLAHQTSNGVYNVGLSNANLSKRELCGLIKKQLPNFYFVESEIGKDQDQRNYVVSNVKIEKTGFKPEVSLEEGIRELIKGYQIIKRKQFSNV